MVVLSSTRPIQESSVCIVPIFFINDVVDEGALVRAGPIAVMSVTVESHIRLLIRFEKLPAAGRIPSVTFRSS